MIVIHHGSGVKQGVAEVLEDYQVIREFGHLKTDDAKELMALYSQAWPQRNPALLAGPLDDVDPKVMDILLKRIEEPIPHAPTLVLWAHDLGSVPQTIRSRCGETFHYAPSQPSSQAPLAKSLLNALRAQDKLALMGVLRVAPKGAERELLEAFLEEVVSEGEFRFYDEGLKGLLSADISRLGVTGYFLTTYFKGR